MAGYLIAFVLGIFIMGALIAQRDRLGSGGFNAWLRGKKGLAVGAALRLQGQSGVRGASVLLMGIKLLALPLAAALVGRWLGLTGLYYNVVVLFAALPTASSAYILAMRMGGDGQSVAWLISATTLGSMLTMPLWAAWLVG